MSAKPLIALLIALCSEPAISQSNTAVDVQTCPGDVAAVSGASPVDLADICRGVSSALDFLARHEVRRLERVVIEVTSNIPKAAGPTAAGCYIEQRRRIFIVPYNTFRKTGTWFGISISRELYRALATHETAHAVGACHFKIPNPTIQAKEYLAYVTMFSVMPAELRARAFRQIKTEGFSSFDRFTPLLYSFDPMRFGAEAYRHFSAATDQTAIIQNLLAGKLLLD